MTLKDIAQEAGVSVSTVSRVINGKGKSVASKEVQDRIWSIVRRTNYVPNRSAQELRRNITNSEDPLPETIECLLARMPFLEKDYFFSEIARNIETELHSNNYILQYSFTSSGNQLRNTAQELKQNTAKGLIILGRCNQNILATLKQHFRKICYVGLNYLNANYDQVICDGMEASKAAVNYLIELGHSKIGYIGETRNEIRYIGYRCAMIEHNLPTLTQYVADFTLSYKGGYDGAKRLIECGADITAVFCANDTTAIGAMSAFQEAGLKIPEDISVIGVDDIELSRYISPALTTISIPVAEMGKVASKIMIDRINGGHKIPLKVLLPFSLEVRESTAPLPLHKQS